MRLVVERSGVGVDDGIGLHVMNVADRFVDFCRAVDLRFIGGQRRGTRLRARRAARQASVRALA